MKAEFKLLELSERSSSVASKSTLRRVRSIKDSNKGSGIGAVPRIFFSVNQNSQEFYDGGVTELGSTEAKNVRLKKPDHERQSQCVSTTRQDILKQIPLLVLKKFLRPILTDKVEMSMLIYHHKLVMMEVTLLLFFYEGQVRRLMSESPCSERHLDIFRVACVGQPRELVNLFRAPKKNLSTSERVEKAISRLPERYVVLAGLLTEPEIVRIRTGFKVVHTVASLKAFNEDLNTLKLFSDPHNEKIIWSVAIKCC